MYKIDLRRDRGGFTLVELLLAIFLVSIFSYFVFSTPRTFKTVNFDINISTLPAYLQNSLKGDGEVICTDNCKECIYKLDGTDTEMAIKLPVRLRVENQYILDKNGNPIKVAMGRYNDKRICLRLRHYSNGSISQLILEEEGRYIFIPAYFFREGREFGSLNEAVDWWMKSSRDLDSKSNWY